MVANVPAPAGYCQCPNAPILRPCAAAGYQWQTQRLRHARRQHLDRNTARKALKWCPRSRGCSVAVRAQGPGTVKQDEALPVQPAQEVVIPVKMNNTPHRRELRQFFYQDVSNAVKNAIKGGVIRMSARCIFPETNREMDVYRIGTILEMVRELATELAADGQKVKCCVQGKMGVGIFKGLPLNLAGVRQIMGRMDWGDATDFVRFGEVGADENVVGNTIMTNLGEMVAAAEDQGKPIVLVNPVLKDIPSHSGVMGVRGRAERMALSDSFEQIYHFRLLYCAGSFYPIMGALRYSYGEPWKVYKRVDIDRRNEEYQFNAAFPTEPNSGQITNCFKLQPPKKQPNAWW